jgi:hypothetical protein
MPMYVLFGTGWQDHPGIHRQLGRGPLRSRFFCSLAVASGIGRTLAIRRSSRATRHEAPGPRREKKPPLTRPSGARNADRHYGVLHNSPAASSLVLYKSLNTKEIVVHLREGAGVCDNLMRAACNLLILKTERCWSGRSGMLGKRLW